MDKNSLLNELSQFLKTEPACKQSITCLSSSAEIGIKVADSYSLRVTNQNGQVEVEEQTPQNADFIFKASPAAVETLINEKGLSAGKLGVKLLKQIINGDIKVSMQSNLFQISSRGYLNIVKVGGLEFLAELKKHDLSSIPKILEALKKLRKN